MEMDLGEFSLYAFGTIAIFAGLVWAGKTWQIPVVSNLADIF